MITRKAVGGGRGGKLINELISNVYQVVRMYLVRIFGGKCTMMTSATPAAPSSQTLRGSIQPGPGKKSVRTTALASWCRGGGAYSFVACCLSHLTIDHAFLSRRSTVPTPNRDTSNIWALITLFPYNTLNCLLKQSPSCFAVCGHHPSPRI